MRGAQHAHREKKNNTTPFVLYTEKKQHKQTNKQTNPLLFFNNAYPLPVSSLPSCPPFPSLKASTFSLSSRTPTVAAKPMTLSDDTPNISPLLQQSVGTSSGRRTRVEFPKKKMRKKNYSHFPLPPSFAFSELVPPPPPPFFLCSCRVDTSHVLSPERQT